ncbi:hypothetical protein [Embleya sp. NPDC059259]|uniref:hypothetical protein n=1 Tax=unclassified Embleya TaxID=2699296 RepID=UPI00368FAA96
MPDTAHAPRPATSTARPPYVHAIAVLNPGDHVQATRRLIAVEGQNRVVVRPSPGGRVGDLALDVLAASGHSPDALLDERASVAAAWRSAAAWMLVDRVEELVVDRAHLLPTGATIALAELAARVGARLWLMWSTPDHPQPLLDELADIGCDVEAITLPDFYQRLPLPARHTRWTSWSHPSPHVWPDDERGRVLLPAHDFPLFLDVCRATLRAADFVGVRAEYDHEFHDTTRWFDSHRALDPADLAATLAFRLRDHRIAPAPSPEHALIRLRATQAALFLKGWLLRWQPQLLGQSSAGRLLGVLTPDIAERLRATATPQAAAATALSLHLCTGTDGFGDITMGDTRPDGFHLIAHPDHDPTRGHICGPDPVVLPEHGMALFSAHLATRRAQGAEGADPVFLHPHSTANPDAALLEAVRRACHRIHATPPWLHRPSYCRHGRHVPREGKLSGWMNVGALDLVPLSEDLRARL